MLNIRSLLFARQIVYPTNYTRLCFVACFALLTGYLHWFYIGLLYWYCSTTKLHAYSKGFAYNWLGHSTIWLHCCNSGQSVKIIKSIQIFTTPITYNYKLQSFVSRYEAVSNACSCHFCLQCRLIQSACSLTEVYARPSIIELAWGFIH